MSAPVTQTARLDEISRLRRRRPRNRFVIWSLRAMTAIVVLSWSLGGFSVNDWFGERRLVNLQRFWQDLRPWPLRDQAWDWTVAADWAAGLWRSGGGEALAATLAMSVVAIVLAGMAGAALSLPAARNVACPRPFLSGGKPPTRRVRWAWRAVVFCTRLLLAFLRSIPEYVWAFLLLAMLGPVAWPLILALVLHNAGILGKLTADAVENTGDDASRALRGLGASRFQIVWASIFPLSLPRFLLYFFYRWETCVREATVLGMLGLASLGFWIVDARARNRYDEMLFFILLGVVLVLAGDLISALTRRFVRNR